MFPRGRADGRPMNTARAAGWPAALVAHRHARGLSQRDLAELAGLSLRAIRDLEHGRVRRPRPSSLERIAAALGLTDAQRAALVDGVTPAAGPPRLTILGPLQLTRDGAVVPLTSALQRDLLGLLALHAGAVLSRDELIAALWVRPPRTAADLLQAHLARLRDLLEPGRPTGVRSAVIEATGGGYRLT